MTLSFRQSFEELEGKCKRPAKMANLAFDGRRKSFRTPALPAIVSHRMTATVSVVVGAIGGVNRWGLPHGSLRRDLVSGVGPRGISDAGMELESNGLVHRNLTACSGLELVEESASSKREMARSILEKLDPGILGRLNGSC